MRLPDSVQQAVNDGLLTLSRSADGTPITAYFEGDCRAFAGLCELTSLRRLAIDSSDVSDECFQSIQSLVNLKELSLQFTSLAGRAFCVLPSLSSLEQLCCNPHVDVSTACSNIAMCSGLRQLNMEACPLNNEHIQLILSLPLLSDLSVAQAKYLDDTVFAGNWTIKSPLKRFSASDTTLGDNAATALSRIDTLHCVRLSNTAVTDSVMKCLGGIDSLHELAVNRTAITDAGIEFLQKARNLRNLEAAECKVSGDAVPRLLRMPSLRYLDVGRTNISEHGLKRLRRAGIQLAQ